MKFKLEGSWYYAPVIFEEEDITVAVSTTLNIEGELSIWDEMNNKWDWLFLSPAGYETNLELLERYGVDAEKRKLCDYKRGRDDVLFCKTDYYFSRGGGIINLVEGKVTDRYEWNSYYRCNEGKKLRDCKLSGYNLYPEKGIMYALPPRKRDEGEGLYLNFDWDV